MSDSSSSTLSRFSALVLGGTGAIGAELVSQLLSSDACTSLTTLGRRDEEARAPKHHPVRVDYEDLSASASAFNDVDVAFCALGTTRKDAGSAEAFRRVDHDYVLEAAKLAKDAGVKHFSIVTSQGANANSWFLYMRTKGEVESALEQLDFARLSIAQPGLLDRGEKTRWNEKLGKLVLGSTKVGKVAEAMIADAQACLASGADAEQNKVKRLTKFSK